MKKDPSILEGFLFFHPAKRKNKPSLQATVNQTSAIVFSKRMA